MFTEFKVEKALQATSYLLSKHPEGRARYYCLMKMLYMADRRSIKERGTPITTDTHVAFEHGPSLSNTYNCIKGEHPCTDRFAQHIRRDGSYHLLLVRGAGKGKLSRFELLKLDEVYEEFKDFTWELWRDYTHTLPEWQKHDPSRNPHGSRSERIHIEDILEAVGLADQTPAIVEDLLAQQAADRFFGK